MTDDHRESYDELLTMIQEAGYELVKEQYQSYTNEPDFQAKLWLIPPGHSEEDDDRN